MQSTFRHRGVYSTQTPEQIKARQRMAQFPDWESGKCEVLVVAKDKWVPVVRLMGKVRDRDPNVLAVLHPQRRR